jgi:predicted transcriptional regulator
MNEGLLAPLGLSANEITLFKAVLDKGEITPASLAKISGIKRTTAYSIARNLVEKGLLVEDATRRPRIFRPSTPEEVLNLVEVEKKRTSEKEKFYKTFAEELSKISAEKSYPVPSVRFVPEEKIDSFLRQQSPVWDQNLLETETTWWGFQDHTFVEHYGEWIKWYWAQNFKAIDLKLLSNRSPVEIQFSSKADPQQSKRRIIKFWGEATNFLSTLWVAGDYLVMINTRTRPFYLVEIHDKLMAHDQREVFRNLWPLVG